MRGFKKRWPSSLVASVNMPSPIGKVNVPNLVSNLDRTPIFEYYVSVTPRTDTKNKLV